jgi:hypothetical protein
MDEGRRKEVGSRRSEVRRQALGKREEKEAEGRGKKLSR